MLLSDADWLAIDRELAKRSLAEFAKMAWHILEPSTPLKWGWVLDGMCEHLTAVTDGEITRLLANVPPGTMKSLLTNVVWPAWEWGPRNMQHTRFLSTAHAANLAIRDNTKCRRLIQSDWFQERWPVQITGDQNAKTKFENSKTGFREAMAFTSMTGSRGDRVILDDPISADNSNSAAELENARVTFTETLPTRVNNEKSAIVVVMQRLNEKDTSGVILDMGLPYEHFCVPMRFESDRRCSTSIGWKDPRTDDGQLMFPERFSDAQVKELETTLGEYGVAGQLQQRPAPRGGGVIKTEWWRYYKRVPDLEYRVIYGDTAAKTSTKNDYSVFQCWGRTVTGQALLLDQIRGKWEAPELLVQARAFYNKHASNTTMAALRAFKVEDASSGIGLIQTLSREGVPLVGIRRDKDKLTRAYNIAPHVEAGNVYLPEGAPWLSQYLAEIEQFPNGAHDDQLDPTMDAISDIMTPRSSPKIRTL